MSNLHFKTIICYIIVFLFLMILFTCSEKSTEPVNDNTVTISPEGGEYLFPDDILLRVPPGAVAEDTDIMLKKISADKLTSVYNSRGIPISDLLVCIEGKPDGMEFIHPVQVCISKDIIDGEIAFVHEVDLSSGEYTPAETEIIYNAEKDSLIISITHFSSFFVEILSAIKEFFGGCSEVPCRCGGNYKSVQSDKDYLCDNGICQITESKVSVTFYDCPGSPVEESLLREVGAGCNPELVLTAGNVTVPTDGQTSVKAQINLGCEPTGGQSIDFSISGPATLNPTYTTTNTNGGAYTTFTAGNEEGMATVTARSTVSYYSYTVSAVAGDLSETNNGPLITKELNESIQIKIEKPEERWSGTLTYEENYSATFLIQKNYSVDFQFSIMKESTANHKDIVGMANATQEYSMTDLYPEDCFIFQNIHAEPTLELNVSGYLEIDSNYVNLTFGDKYDPHFAKWVTYDMCFICVFPDEDIDCVEEGGSGYLFISNEYAGDHSNIPLSEGTYSSTYNFNDYQDWTVSYTITLHREQ